MTPKQQRQQRATLTTAHYDYQKALNVHAFFKVRDHAIGEDLVQDTFVKTWSYLLRGGKIEMMKAFLYHILNNLIVDQYRRHKTASLDALLENGFEPSDETHSSRLFNALDGKTALRLIERLPVTYQKVMRLRYTKGLSLTEMSLITGQTKNTIAVQIHRGVEKLKVLYQPA